MRAKREVLAPIEGNDSKDGVFRYLSPEDIDKIILRKLELFHQHKHGNGNTNNWTETELKYRNQVILDYYRQGLSKTRVMEELMNRWGIGESTGRRWVREAINALVADNEDYIEKARDIMTERIQGIAEGCVERGQIDQALKAYDMLNKISGLYNEKKELEIKGDNPITFKFQ